MKDNEVWDLVDLPPNGKTVGSKWLFKKKTDMDGAVHTYKARLGAKVGYTQTPVLVSRNNLKRYHMENSKRGSIPMQEKLRLSTSQSASTPAELKRMQNVPYASAVGSICCCEMYCRSDVASQSDHNKQNFKQNPG
ncbi:retrotransposon protein, putative, ty1-copia subclass [Tanacetum coccineum]|uniref:Retrotransposon protein, putative, ty1-copia subclass n=1 Tax=Tanacetum coccineum TaxID=301880 RepID=A0ABQ5ESK6_9ASTR